MVNMQREKWEGMQQKSKGQESNLRWLHQFMGHKSTS